MTKKTQATSYWLIITNEELITALRKALMICEDQGVNIFPLRKQWPHGLAEESNGPSSFGGWISSGLVPSGGSKEQAVDAVIKSINA